MPYYKDNFLILDNKILKDKDLIIIVLSELFGKRDIIVKGVRGLKSRFRGASEPFTFCKGIIHYKENSPNFLLSSVDIIETFCSINDDKQKLKVGFILLNLIKNFLQYNQVIKDFFSNTIKFFKQLKKTENPEIIEILFTLWFIKKIGYQPNINHCSFCNKILNDKFYLDLLTHSLVCFQCGATNNKKLFSYNLLNFLKESYLKKSINFSNVKIDVKIKNEILNFFHYYFLALFGRKINF